MALSKVRLVGGRDAYGGTDEHATADDTRQDEDTTQDDISNRRQPECVPVQRRVTVIMSVAMLRREVACPVDPHIA